MELPPPERTKHNAKRPHGEARPSAGEVKLLGAYSSKAAAREAMIRFPENPELRGLECFATYALELDQDRWTEGRSGG